jgi:hypothetical protein
MGGDRTAASWPLRINRNKIWGSRVGPPVRRWSVRRPAAEDEHLKFLPEDRTRLQARAEAALIPHPHRLELRGSPEALVWPDVCAYCGSASGERIRVSVIFLGGLIVARALLWYFTGK